MPWYLLNKLFALVCIKPVQSVIEAFDMWGEFLLLITHVFRHCSIADVIRFSWLRWAWRESGKICDFLFSHHLIANKRNGKVFIPFCWMDVLWMVPFPVRTLLFQENRKLFHVYQVEKQLLQYDKGFSQYNCCLLLRCVVKIKINPEVEV